MVPMFYFFQTLFFARRALWNFACRFTITSWVQWHPSHAPQIFPSCKKWKKIYQNIGTEVHGWFTNEEHSLNIVWTLSKHCQNIVWTFSEHCQNIVWTFSEHCLNILWTLSEHCLNILWTLSEHCQNIVLTFCNML